jgi:hypothetical protein
VQGKVNQVHAIPLSLLGGALNYIRAGKSTTLKSTPLRRLRLIMSTNAEKIFS